MNTLLFLGSIGTSEILLIAFVVLLAQLHKSVAI